MRPSAARRVRVPRVPRRILCSTRSRPHQDAYPPQTPRARDALGYMASISPFFWAGTWWFRRNAPSRANSVRFEAGGWTRVRNLTQTVRHHKGDKSLLQEYSLCNAWCRAPTTKISGRRKLGREWNRYPASLPSTTDCRKQDIDEQSTGCAAVRRTSFA